MRLSIPSLKPKVKVCLTPALIGNYNLTDSYVVVIDILRATTSMCVAFDNGVEHIIPVESIEECHQYAKLGYVCAAERNGETVPGFQYGNSPFSFIDPNLKGKKLALTTTNGTKAIQLSKKCKKLIIGAFANLSLLSNFLIEENQPVILHCAGWKNNINLEDTIFAGALIDRLLPYFDKGDDAAIMARCLYEEANSSKREYISKSSHYQRLIQLNLQKDVKYCLRQDIHPVLPVLEEDRLINSIPHKLNQSNTYQVISNNS